MAWLIRKIESNYNYSWKNISINHKFTQWKCHNLDFLKDGGLIDHNLITARGHLVSPTLIKTIHQIFFWSHLFRGCQIGLSQKIRSYELVKSEKKKYQKILIFWWFWSNSIIWQDLQRAQKVMVSFWWLPFSKKYVNFCRTGLYRSVIRKYLFTDMVFNKFLSKT